MKPDHSESILKYQESGAFNEQNVLKSQRFVFTTATALEDSSSSGDMEEKYAMFVSVYTTVTSGMEMYMARGRFLRKNK